MASVAPTYYTNQVEKTDEAASFSPAVLKEMDTHTAKYPPERKRSALIPLLFVIQRERGYVDNAGGKNDFRRVGFNRSRFEAF